MWTTLHIIMSAYELLYAIYVFFYGSSYWDIPYIVLIVSIYTHWLFLKNECIISIKEKQIYDPNYKIGQCPYIHPFVLYLEKHFKYFPLLCLMFIATLYVIAQTKMLPLIVKGFILIVMITYFIHGSLNDNTYKVPYCTELRKKIQEAI
jgi:hypothetical protein